MAPLQRRPQGLLAWWCAAACALEHIYQGDFEPLGYLLHGQRSHSGGGELYSQRYTVQLPAHPRHSSRVRFGEPEVGQPQAGAIDEETNRFIAREALDGGLSIRRGR